MPVSLLIQPSTAAERLLAAIFGDPRPVVFHTQFKAFNGFEHAQSHVGIRPLASVVQQVAEQFQQVLTIPRQLQALGGASAQRQVLTMDHVQGRQQSRQFGIAIKQCSRQCIAGETGTVEFAIEPLLHLLQLRLEGFAQLRMRVQLCT